jgi:TolA-binding protein
LLEEPLPQEPVSRVRRDDEDRGEYAERREEGRPVLPRRSQRRNSDPEQFRERIREQAGSAERLDERDYEIMTTMAEGIRPILDRLDEIDNRVARMEVGDEPVPSDPRGWLSTQLADTLRDPRSGGDVALGRSVTDLEARLPELIEGAVTRRFQQMAGKLQQEIEETHVRTLETFVKNIQVKLVKRVAALETDMGKQAEAMNQMRESSLRTEDNLSRLITGVDKLAQELPKRLAPSVSEAHVQEPAPAQTLRTVKRRASSRSRRIKIFWVVVVCVLLVAVPTWFIAGRSGGSAPVEAVAAGGPGPGSAGRPAPPAANADTKTKMQAAQEYVDRKDYAPAEDLYRQVIKTEPNNVEALKALASVLYREDKIDESAAILDKIPKD